MNHTHRHIKKTGMLIPVFRHYLPFVKRYGGKTAVLMLSYAFAAGLSSLLLPVFYKEIIDTVLANEEGVRASLMFILMLIALTILAYNILFRLGDYLLVQVQTRTLKELADEAVSRLTEHSYTYFANTHVGSIVSKTRRYVAAFETLQDQVVFNLLMNAVTLIGAVTILSLQSPLLGAVFLGWFLLYGFLIRFLVHIQVPKTAAAAEADSAVGARYADLLANVLTVKMFGAEQGEHASFSVVTEKHRALRFHALVQEVFKNGITQGALIGIFNVGMLWVTMELWLRGTVSAGTIVLVQLYVMSSFDMVWRMSRNIVRISASLTDAHEMVEILERPLDVKDPVSPHPFTVTRGAVRFAGVSFAYEGEEVIRGLDFAISPGEKVALVGHSGAGKSTVVKLLLRFVDPTMGAITIDDIDIRTVAQRDVRRHIAYVPQEPLLFHRTLRENIAYGYPNASQEEVEAVSRNARVHEFAARLPQGYDTLVGERGVKLSGGERQRVAIARAMLTGAPIVLLDEATSSLDSVSERSIQSAFDVLMQGKTTVVIAHRLSTIQHMDRIVVLDHGQVAEVGTHTELLAQGGIYAELWRSQVDGFIRE